MKRNYELSEMSDGCYEGTAQINPAIHARFKVQMDDGNVKYFMQTSTKHMPIPADLKEIIMEDCIGRATGWKEDPCNDSVQDMYPVDPDVGYSANWKPKNWKPWVGVGAIVLSVLAYTIYYSR